MVIRTHSIGNPRSVLPAQAISAVSMVAAFTVVASTAGEEGIADGRARAFCSNKHVVARWARQIPGQFLPSLSP